MVSPLQKAGYAIERGSLAQQRNRPRDSNPHVIGNLRRAWAIGWDVAELEMRLNEEGTENG